MRKGKNKHNSKIWDLVENYFNGNITEAINFFEEEHRKMAGELNTYKATYFSEKKNINQQLMICDKRPPFDKETNFIHVAVGEIDDKNYSYEFKTEYDTVFIPEDIPYLGDTLNYNRALVENYIEKAPGQEDIQKENLRNLNNELGKYIEDNKYFDSSQNDKKKGIFKQFFGIFLGNKKVNNILRHISEILSEYGLMDLETAQQINELEKLQKKYNDFLPFDEEKLFLKQPEVLKNSDIENKNVQKENTEKNNMQNDEIKKLNINKENQEENDKTKDHINKEENDKTKDHINKEENDKIKDHINKEENIQKEEKNKEKVNG